MCDRLFDEGNTQPREAVIIRQHLHATTKIFIHLYQCWIAWNTVSNLGIKSPQARHSSRTTSDSAHRFHFIKLAPKHVTTALRNRSTDPHSLLGKSRV